LSKKTGFSIYSVMNILADESVDQPVVQRLRQDRHAVLYVAEMEPGVSDDAVLDRAKQNNGKPASKRPGPRTARVLCPSAR